LIRIKPRKYVILSALTGAIIWDLLTWWWGLPTSSSHALIGGLAGAAIRSRGLACSGARTQTSLAHHWHHPGPG